MCVFCDPPPLAISKKGRTFVLLFPSSSLRLRLNDDRQKEATETDRLKDTNNPRDGILLISLHNKSGEQ